MALPLQVQQNGVRDWGLPFPCFEEGFHQKRLDVNSPLVGTLAYLPGLDHYDFVGQLWYHEFHGSMMGEFDSMDVVSSLLNCYY